MTNYKPQVGDKVRRTHSSGTTVEGEIRNISIHGSGEDPLGFELYSPLHPEQTELLFRPEPEPLKKEFGVVYGLLDDPSCRAVYLPASPGDGAAWLAAGIPGSIHKWHPDSDIQRMINEDGWIELHG